MIISSFWDNNGMVSLFYKYMLEIMMSKYINKFYPSIAFVSECMNLYKNGIIVSVHSHNIFLVAAYILLFSLFRPWAMYAERSLLRVHSRCIGLVLIRFFNFFVSCFAGSTTFGFVCVS